MLDAVHCASVKSSEQRSKQGGKFFVALPIDLQILLLLQKKICNQVARNVRKEYFEPLYENSISGTLPRTVHCVLWTKKMAVCAGRNNNNNKKCCQFDSPAHPQTSKACWK